MDQAQIIEAIKVLAQVVSANGGNNEQGIYEGIPSNACDAANKKIIELIEKLKP